MSNTEGTQHQHRNSSVHGIWCSPRCLCLVLPKRLQHGPRVLESLSRWVIPMLKKQSLLVCQRNRTQTTKQAIIWYFFFVFFFFVPKLTFVSEPDGGNTCWNPLYLMKSPGFSVDFPRNPLTRTSPVSRSHASAVRGDVTAQSLLGQASGVGGIGADPITR